MEKEMEISWIYRQKTQMNFNLEELWEHSIKILKWREEENEKKISKVLENPNNWDHVLKRSTNIKEFEITISKIQK